MHTLRPKHEFQYPPRQNLRGCATAWNACCAAARPSPALVTDEKQKAEEGTGAWRPLLLLLQPKQWGDQLLSGSLGCYKLSPQPPGCRLYGPGLKEWVQWHPVRTLRWHRSNTGLGLVGKDSSPDI